MLWASVIVSFGLLLVLLAKTEAAGDPAAGDHGEQTLNLNTITGSEQILPYLATFTNAADREFAAKKIYSSLKDSGAAKVPNVGQLAKLTVSEKDISSTPNLEFYSTRLQDEKKRMEKEVEKGERPQAAELKLPLLTTLQFGRLKPHMTVRSTEQFRSRLL